MPLAEKQYSQVVAFSSYSFLVPESWCGDPTGDFSSTSCIIILRGAGHLVGGDSVSNSIHFDIFFVKSKRMAKLQSVDLTKFLREMRQVCNYFYPSWKHCIEDFFLLL